MASAGEPGRHAPRFARASTNLLVLTPIRLALGLAGLCATAVIGDAGPALLGFAVGAVGTTIALSSDRRYSRSLLGEIPPLPAGGRVASKRELATAGIVPSTVTVTVLMVFALVFNATLAAVLAGVLGGMAASGTIAFFNLRELERANAYELYVRQPGGGVFQAPRREAATDVSRATQA